MTVLSSHLARYQISVNPTLVKVFSGDGTFLVVERYRSSYLSDAGLI